MTKKITAFLLAALILGGVSYSSSYLYSSKSTKRQAQELKDAKKEQEAGPHAAREEQAETASRPTASKPENVRAERREAEKEAQIEEEAAYILVEEFGYVNIYLGDGETVYEFTDIPIDSLPEELKEEICVGKALQGEQDLYDFLENYSS